MKPTIYESPFSASSFDEFVDNIAYARMMVRTGATHYGEAGFGSHLVWTQPGVLRDGTPYERQLGIDCGLAFTALAHGGAIAHVFGVDRGWSRGMKHAAEVTRERELAVVERSLCADLGEVEFDAQMQEMREHARQDARAWWEWMGR